MLRNLSGRVEMLENIIDWVQASDVSFSNDSNAVISWVVRAIQNLLEAASRMASIKRFVLVSSSSAAYYLYPDPQGREIHQGGFQSLRGIKNPD